MIIVRLMGGHSNQLFQYAIGRSLAKRNNTELVLDLSWFKDFADVDTPRVYELDCYPLRARTVDSLAGMKIIDPKQGFSKIDATKRRLGIGSSIWMHYENGYGFDEKILELPNNTLLVGFWQSEKYFLDIREELLKELEPIKNPDKKNSALIEQIRTSESIWMHIRRGDYITNKHAKKFHGVKNADYYTKALDTLVSKIKPAKRNDIKIFVCSNDIDWCKKYLKLPYPTLYIENELGSDDMRVAKHCKHDIIANSTFSWWGAWLNENHEKIVVAPKKWFEDKTANSQTDIAIDSWIRV